MNLKAVSNMIELARHVFRVGIFVALSPILPKDKLPEVPSSRTPPSFNHSPLYDEIRITKPFFQVKLYDESAAWIATKHRNTCNVLIALEFYNRCYSRGKYPELREDARLEDEKPIFVYMDDPERARQKV